MKKVLILGAGLVVKPMVEYLLENSIKLIIASPMQDRAAAMIAGNPLGTAIDWSMDDPETLEILISESDLTVSLLPYKYHADVARICVRHGKSLVTTSYVQKEMLELDAEAKRRGILLLNEIGLDPGIDHLSAMKIIDNVHANGGTVDEFYSLCGALPAPESAGNPMKYKFSWSPKGVVLASLNSALYLKNGRKIFIEPVNLFKDRFIYHFSGLGDFEVYPNRDSISYTDIYGIREAKTMYRGTLRYMGWCETLDAMKSLDMLGYTVRDYFGKTYREFLAERSGTGLNRLKENIAGKLGIPENSPAIQSLEFLGFFSDEKLPYSETTPFEITSDRMIEKMSLLENERDMILLQHIILAAWPNGRKEVIKSSMTAYGSPSENTAISRTVALPAAIAVRLILENKISATGVQRPVMAEIYNPVLEELQSLGIEMKEEYGLPESEMIK